MNNNSLESKVVSYKPAKRMSKLGWRKETVFCWVKLKGQKIPKLCHCDLKNDEQFYTVGNCQLIPFWDIENWCYGPLFCEIWDELPEEIQDLISGDRYRKILFDNNSIGYCQWSLGSIDVKILVDKSNLIQENASDFWCYLKEQGYIKEA